MDSFMHNHQSALDSFMEDKAIQDLEDAGIYPVPDNDAILENLFEDALEEVTRKNKYQFPPCTEEELNSKPCISCDDEEHSYMECDEDNWTFSEDDFKTAKKEN